MALIGLPSLIVGIVLMTAGTSGHWFSGVHTVGVILMLASAIVIVIGLLVFLMITAGFVAARKKF